MNRLAFTRSSEPATRVIRGQQRKIRIGGSSGSKGTRQFPVSLQLVIGLSVLIAIGTGLLLIPGASTRQISVMEAVFTSTSAAAVTGLSLFPDQH